MSTRDPISDFRKVSEVLHETRLVITILQYAETGHCSPLMIEQAIEMVDRHIAVAQLLEDASLKATAEKLKGGLEVALREGVESLRRARGPGPEITEVEIPLVRSRQSRGHRVRRQHRCSAGIVDIYDLTADELIECKHRGTSAALGAAASQLNRYRKSFPGASLAIAVMAVEQEALWLADILRDQGITIIEIDRVEKP